MIILVRNESFGQVVFQRDTRKHKFISSKEKIKDKLTKEQKQFFCNELGIKYDPEDVEFVIKGIEYQKNVEIKNRLSAPLCLYLEITQWCPLNCAHCYKPDKPENEEKLTLDDYKKIIFEAHEMGVFEVRLCGNEPVLSEYFFEVCQFIKQLKMHLSINTSGRLNDYYKKLLIDAEPDFVVVSMDAIPEIHDAVRCPGAFENSYSILRKLTERNIECRINCVLSKKTMNYIQEMVDTAKSIPCGISFIPLRTMGRPSWFKSEESMNPDAIRFCNNEITRCRMENLELPLEMFFDTFGGDFTAHHLMDFNTPCPAGKNGFVSAQASFYPCDWIRYLNEKYYCGNVLEEGLKNIWNFSKVLKDFQCIKRVGCEECKYYLKRCYGGCWCSYTDTISNHTYIDHLCPIMARNKYT